jgi:hypothetical protein
MEKEFVPYEQALALKELGFDEDCVAYYGEINGGEIMLFLKKNFDNQALYFLAPLYQQAFRWFREKYNIQCYWYNNNSKHLKHCIVIQVSSTQPIQFSTKSSVPELECLKKLIEIIKNK